MIINTKVSKNVNDIFNILKLNQHDYEYVQSQMQLQKSYSLMLRLMNSKSNIIEQFIVKKCDDYKSVALLNASNFIEDQDLFSEVVFINNLIEISNNIVNGLYSHIFIFFKQGQVIKLKISFVSDDLNLLYINQVLDVEDLIKRQIIRQNQILSNNTQFQVKILENIITLKINEIIYEDSYIINQMFKCTNLSLLDIYIDYTSLLKFKKFYKIQKQTYLQEILNYDPSEELQNSLQKFNHWLAYSQQGQQNQDEIKFLDSNIIQVFLKSNGSQKSELQAQISKFMIKQQIDLFNENQNFQQEDQIIENNQQKLNIKVRYLNFRDIILHIKENLLDNLLMLLAKVINRENQRTYGQQIMLVIDSCEMLMEQDKYNENINKFNIFKQFVQEIKAILFITKQEKKQYYQLPEKISNINL